jgi:hypothetical protein
LQVAKLCAPRIHLDKIGCVAAILHHEVQPEESGQSQPSRNPFCAKHHLGVVDDTHYRGGTLPSLRAHHLHPDSS